MFQKGRNNLIADERDDYLISRGFFSLYVVSIALSLFPDIAFSRPLDGRSVFEHYCAVCHGKGGEGDGVNAEYLDPPPANLTDSEIASLSDGEIAEVIKKGGAGVELSAAMPPWGNTLSEEEIASVISYIRALQKRPPPAGVARLSDLKEGETKCPACHVDQAARQIAPDLSHEGSKFYREWLYGFLKHPDRIRPVGFIPLTKTKMPNFNFTDEEANAVTEYLMTLKEDRFAGKGIQINLSAQSAEKGQSLFNDVYGCFGCHKTAPNGEGGIVGPNLSNAAKRLKPQWIAAWLKDPESIRPDSPMPNFNLSGEEIQQLVAYILSLGPRGDAPSDAAIPAQMEVAKKGEELVLKKNCVFCHLLDTKKGQKDQNGSEGEAALTEAKLK